MTSKPGRPLGRRGGRDRRSWAHPGASPEKGKPVFPSSPRSPLLHNGARERWPIDADAPWKSHGRLRSTASTEPSTAFSTELGKPANGCRFSTSVNRPAALRSGVFAPLFSSLRTDTGSIINPSTKSGQVHSAKQVALLEPPFGTDEVTLLRVKPLATPSADTVSPWIRRLDRHVGRHRRHLHVSQLTRAINEIQQRARRSPRRRHLSGRPNTCFNRSAYGQ